MTTEHLSDQQIARVEALQAAKAVGVKTTGPFGGSTPPDTTDLVNLAEYILNGTHPMDRYGKKEEEKNGDHA
jgi:hypothetical protein